VVPRIDEAPDADAVSPLFLLLLLLLFVVVVFVGIGFALEAPVVAAVVVVARAEVYRPVLRGIGREATLVPAVRRAVVVVLLLAGIAEDGFGGGTGGAPGPRFVAELDP